MFISRIELTRVTRLLCAFILIASGTGVIFAQSTTADLSGTVIDEQGAVVPGVILRVSNPATNLVRSVTTNDDGSFTIQLLPPGSYTLRAERAGFAPTEIKDVALNVNDRRTIRINLRVGDVGATVTVESAPVLIDESQAITTTVDREFVENLPLNGRSFQSLLELTPGVVLTKADFFQQGQFSVNGQRPNANYFTVDGVSANVGISSGASLGQSAGGTLPAFAATGGTNNLVSVDALQEFRIQTSSFAAEFGRTPGAQVQLITRSGTNGFHGSAFNYFRNDVFDANDFFANTAGQPRPALRQNNFGGTLSGPVFFPRFGEGGSTVYNGRDRTFFFFSYEGLRLRQPQFATRSVPTLAARASAAAQVRPFFNAFPRPNGADLGDGLAEFSASFSTPTNLDATSVRIDHNFNDRFNVFGRYNYAPSDTEARGALDFLNLNEVDVSKFKTQTLTFGSTMIFNSRVNNEIRFNFSEVRGREFRRLDNFGGGTPLPDSLLFPSGTSSQNGLFALFLGGSANFFVGENSNNRQRQINIVDNLAFQIGSHALKFGVDYRRLTPIFNPRNYTQVLFSFGGVESALMGNIDLAQISADDTDFFPVFDNFSVYAQDTWRASRRLTLTYGVRYEVNPAPGERNGNLPFTVSGIDNPATLALVPSGSKLYETTYNNFAPRFGASYQLSDRAGRETVLRGGIGIFYDLGNGAAGEAFSFGVAPYSRSTLLFGVPYPLSAVNAAPPPLNPNPPFSGTVYAFDRNFKLPYATQYNLSIEQALGSDNSITASYVGSTGRRLTRFERLIDPNTNFSRVDAIRNRAESDYNALQVQFQRRLSEGFQALVSYTFAKSLDTVSDESTINAPTNLLDVNLDRGPSNFDVRHSFTAAFTYNIPAPFESGPLRKVFGGFSFDGIVRARTATPVNIVTGTDPLNLGLSVVRPDVVPNVPFYLDDRSVAGGRRFNPAAFAAPPTGANGEFVRQGTLGRNALRGFSARQLDIALRREFGLTERVKLQFRAELFNAFNTPNFADPDEVLFDFDPSTPNSNFGRSTQMLGRSLGAGGSNGGFNPLYQIGGPRSAQFALKLLF